MGIQTIKDIEALEQRPLEEALSVNSTWQALKQAAEQHADLPALSFFMFGHDDEAVSTWTYTELLRDITKTANAFHAMGVSETAPVSIILPNFPESHFAIWGAECAGVVNPINPFLEAEHIEGIVRAAGSKVVVTLAPNPLTELYDKTIEALKDIDHVEHLVVLNPAHYLPPELASLDTHYPAPEHVKVTVFADLLAQHAGDALNFEREIHPHSRASLFHTGGTTGVPKLAPHTHLNETYMAWAFNEITEAEPGRVMLCGLPLFHVNGVLVTGLGAFSAGAHVILATPQGYRSQGLMQNFWKIVERYQVNTFSGVPTILSSLLNLPINADISSLEYVVCGAAPLSPELFKTFQDKIGVDVVEGYGLTEGTCGSTVNPRDGEKRVGSVGLRMPYQQIKAAIVDHDGSIVRDCDVDEPGAIVMKGPQVFPGYTDAKKNEGVLLADGWMSTGDLGRVDKDGYIWLTGRAKDLIIRGGHNIDPSMIEDVLTEHANVALAAAVGQPDAYAGELPIAYVTLNPEEQVSEDELLRFAKEQISERAAAPVRVEIISEMPQTAVGKIFKPDLREMAARHMVDTTLEELGVSSNGVRVFRDPRKGMCAEFERPCDEANSIVKQLANLSIHARFPEVITE